MSPTHAAPQDARTLNTPELSAVRARLARVGQEHLLTFVDRLEDEQRQSLLAQIAGMEVESLPGLAERYVLSKPVEAASGVPRPAPCHALGGRFEDGLGGTARWDEAGARARGEGLIRAGKVAAFVVAGGQGSRLGFEGPKGCFPAGSVTGKSLFQLFSENLLGVRDRMGVSVPWFIMTSPLNDGATREFFAKHGHFGLRKEDVRFVVQGSVPTFDMRTGKVLLASRGEVATNPDGHGGAIAALHASGSIAEMRVRGVEHLAYFQVDNPLVRVIDPVFVGLHAGSERSSSQMSSKMVRKVEAGEKVGVFVADERGKVRVLEYSDMPREIQEARDGQGRLRFDAGSVAIHMIGLGFLEQLATDPAFALAWHRAEKKVPFVDVATGEAVNPTSNNGVKLEKFIFDALPLCGQSVVMETDRREEFAPIKNATGVDSAESSAALQTDRAARWLEHAGVAVPRRSDGSADCVLEISPRTAGSAEELAGLSLPKAIERGARVAI